MIPRLLRLLWFASIALLPGLLAATARAADVEEVQYNVVVNLYNAGQWQAAISKIEEREKLTLPDAMRSKYLYAKGLAYEKGAKSAEALAAYDQLLAKYPKAIESDPAQLAAMYLRYSLGKHDEIIAGYEKLNKNKLAPADKKNLALVYAESLYAKKDDKRALPAYQAAAAAGADPAGFAARLFELRVRQGLHADLLAQSAQGVPGFPPDMLALVRAESFLALGKYAEAEAEGVKVPAASPYYARACFARAQSLVKLNKLKEAIAPLEVAVAGLKDPPAPPAAYLALAECLLDGGRPAEVEKAVAGAERALAGLPEAEKVKLRAQMALLRIRGAAGDKPKLVQAVTESRDKVPPDQLAKILYMRLFALSELGDQKAVVLTIKDDLPVLAKGTEYGPAALIYYKALRETQRADEGLKLLESFVAAKPDSPDALRAQVALGNAALEKGDHARARTFFDRVSAAPKAAEVLGPAALHELLYNRAVALEKLGDHAETIKSLTALIAAKPAEEILRQALLLLGQAQSAAKNYPAATAAWKQALALGKLADELDVRDRLARVLYAAKDYPGVNEQYAAALKLAGVEEKLPRESREVWARALFDQGNFVESAGHYERLAKSFSEAPGYAFESAVAWSKAGKPKEAAAWYAAARQQKDKLPPQYAAALAANLAVLQLDSGEGDLGLAHWLDAVGAAKDEVQWEAAISAIRKISAAGKVDAAALAKLEAAMNAAAADQARHYALGGVVLEGLAADKKSLDRARALADKLAAELGENEKKLDAKSSGATIGAAMIYFYKAQTQRLSGKPVDAVASYETVLAAYPFNEWPDAAACGAAECYLALGDKDTAVLKFREVADAQPAGAASQKWQELARNRLKDLQTRK